MLYLFDDSDVLGVTPKLGINNVIDVSSDSLRVRFTLGINELGIATGVNKTLELGREVVTIVVSH